MVKYWTLRLILSIASLYFTIYVLDKWIWNLGEVWLAFPTWIIFAILMILLNGWLWFFDMEDYWVGKNVKPKKRRK